MLGGVRVELIHIAVQLAYTCHLFVDDLASLVAGLSNGDLVVWKTKRNHSQTASIQTISLKGHRGPVHALKCVAFDAYSLVFSGSADRTVRVWSPWSENSDSSCTQVSRSQYLDALFITLRRRRALLGTTEPSRRLNMLARRYSPPAPIAPFEYGRATMNAGFFFIHGSFKSKSSEILVTG
jgi:hypothetical protein